MKLCDFGLSLEYYTIIDFNEVDMGIYLPKKSEIHRGQKIEVNITLRVDKSLCLPKLKSIIVLLYDFSTINESFYFHFRS